MAKPYSIDLRTRVLQAYQKQEGSQRQIAERFGVSASFVRDLVRSYRDSGSIEPKTHSGGATAKLTSRQLEALGKWVNASNDASLDELCKRLYQQTRVQVSRSTVCRALQKLKLTRKKRHSTPVSKIANE